MIPIDDLKIETYSIRPQGGQHAGCDPGGVKITHLPSGIEAKVSIGRSQYRNKEIAMDMIIAAITNPYYR